MKMPPGPNGETGPQGLSSRQWVRWFVASLLLASLAFTAGTLTSPHRAPTTVTVTKAPAPYFQEEADYQAIVDAWADKAPCLIVPLDLSRTQQPDSEAVGRHITEVARHAQGYEHTVVGMSTKPDGWTYIIIMGVMCP